jgi:hypothetical protein
MFDPYAVMVEARTQFAKKAVQELHSSMPICAVGNAALFS